MHENNIYYTVVKYNILKSILNTISTLKAFFVVMNSVFTKSLSNLFIFNEIMKCYCSISFIICIDFLLTRC